MKADTLAEIKVERELYEKNEKKLVNKFLKARKIYNKKKRTTAADKASYKSLKVTTNTKMEKLMTKFETYRREMLMSFSDEQDSVNSQNAESGAVTT